MKAGLTPEQRMLLEQVRCDRGHRFDGINYPTPEGTCPRCAWPEFTEDINRTQWLLAEQSVQSRAVLHPSVTGM
jgi:hypothetical protein